MVLDNGLIDICLFWKSNIRITKIAIRFSTSNLVTFVSVVIYVTEVTFNQM